MAVKSQNTNVMRYRYVSVSIISISVSVPSSVCGSWGCCNKTPPQTRKLDNMHSLLTVLEAGKS